MPKPPVTLALTWTEGLQFRAETPDGRTLSTDSDGREGLSPVELLGTATAACMAIDVVHILTKARQPLTGLQVTFTGQRADEEPRRLMAVQLAFTVEGSIPQPQLDRAIQLSRDKYCSVWNSLREDTELEITTEIRVPASR
jgi:putative redox protein